MTLYIDGIQAGQKSLNSLLIIAQNLDAVYIGEDGNTWTFCHCDIAEAEVHDRAFTAEEIKAAHERYVDGPDCP